SFRNTYDANGNPTVQIEAHHDVNAGAGETTTYSYDRLNRLVAVNYGSGGALAYTYDRNGNRLTEIGTDPLDGTTKINKIYAYNRLNELSAITNNIDSTASVGYEYDNNGNRTRVAVGKLTLKDDGHGNPIVSVAAATVTTY